MTPRSLRRDSERNTAPANPLPIHEAQTAPEPNPKGGPRTTEGKAKSSLNNLRHGLTGSFRMMGDEQQDEFDTLLAAFTDEHQPAAITELTLVRKIAEHLWLSRRAQRLQDDALLADDLPRFSIYLRYQTTNDRAFHKCLSELGRLQKERRRQFESQNQEESRQSRVRLANARALHLEVDADIRRSLDIPTQNGLGIPFQEAKELFTRCLVDAAAKLNRRTAETAA